MTDDEETTTIIAALRERRRAYGAEMRQATALAGPLGRQPGETETRFAARFLAMSDEERTLAERPEELRACRRDINRMLKALTTRNPSRAVSRHPENGESR